MITSENIQFNEEVSEDSLLIHGRLGVRGEAKVATGSPEEVVEVTKEVLSRQMLLQLYGELAEKAAKANRLLDQAEALLAQFTPALQPELGGVRAILQQMRCAAEVK